MIDNNIIYHPLKEKLVAIHVPDWDYSFNMDEILQIDYSNIFGEIITIPVLENRMGRLLAEIRAYKKEEKLKLEIKEANVRKLFRNKRSGDGLKKPTIQEEEDHLLTDPVIKNLRFKLIRIEEDVERQEVMYDAVKSKAFKLNNLSKSLTPQEFENELIEGKINGMYIKIKDKKFRQ
jgi:hypothetical protein